MIGKRMGVSTIAFEQPPMLSAWAAVGGKKEQEGPLGAQFDQLFPDTLCGEATWEKAEMHMQQAAVRLAANKCGLPVSALDLMIAGDLLGRIAGRDTLRLWRTAHADCSMDGNGGRRLRGKPCRRTGVRAPDACLLWENLRFGGDRCQ